MSILDVTAIAQGPMLAKQAAQSAAVVLPDNSASHRFEPIAAVADWSLGLTVDIFTQFFVGGNLVGTQLTTGVRPCLLTDGTTEAPHTTFPMNMGLGVTTVVSCTPSLPASVGLRQCAAPTAAQLPAKLPAPVLTQVVPSLGVAG